MTDKEKTFELLGLMDVLCNTNFSKDTATIDDWITKLNKVYANGYRHAYSDIFFKVQQIILDEQQPEVLEVLGENLNVLENRINQLLQDNSEDANYQNTAFGYKKFADHIKLEIGRYNFIKNQFEYNKIDNSEKAVENQHNDDLQQNISKIQVIEKAVNDMRPTVTQAQKQLDGLDEKLEKNKISSITTLTIFSAVILAFSGGITFEAGIFKGMSDSTPYRLVFTIALTGFILFNTIFAMLYLVGKMADKHISTKCKYLIKKTSRSEYCKVCGDGYCIKECSNVTVACRMLHKYTYVFIINSIITYVLYTDFFLWLSHGNIFNPVFWISQLAIVIICIVSVVVYCTSRYLRYKRIKMNCKVFLVENILGELDSGNTSVFFRIGEILSKTFGNSSESLKEKFLNKTETMSSKTALSYFNKFLNEELLKNDRMAVFIPRSRYKVDKVKWKKLKNKFKEYIDNR